MAFSRGQTQVLYQFLPGAIFEHDQYGFCQVTSVEFRETRVNEEALFNAVADLLAQWPSDQSRPGFADPRHRPNRRYYVAGTPTSVRFRPYPTLLECRVCGRVFRLRDLVRRPNAQPRRCPQCMGPLTQLRYVQAHNCGRLEEIYYPATACRRHGSAFLTFHDTGRVRSARWRCGLCGNAEVARLRMTPCTCPYSRSLPQGPGSQYERGLKTLALTDSALYLPHIVPFISFDEDQERGLTGDPEHLCLVLARTWGLLDRALPEVIRERATRRERGPAAAQNDAMTESLVQALEQVDPNHPTVKQWRRQQAEQANPLDDTAIGRVRSLLGSAAPAADAATPRQLFEHIAVLDTLETSSVANVHDWLTELGDRDGAERIDQAAQSARENLGIGDLKIIGNFPIALCAVGYTRITRDPNRSILVPFESSDPQGRMPLYVVSAETEGIYLQLDPVRVVAWLVENHWSQGPAPAAREEAWAWLYRNVLGLSQNRWDANYYDPMTVAVRTLLHTISHVLLRHVEWSGFSQNSVGEYLLPGALACVLYANRYAETKIGGLITLFEQRLGIWLDDSAQSGRDCIYDPFCTDEGATCVGCLHREYNCPQFNRELSRAVLYGGPTPPPELGSDLGIPLIQRGFWENVRPSALAASQSAAQR
ncbi:hypothetical protein [Tautonia sociabilis]|uniref:DUF1998 domain-containing protein n=1 Tax=Tautonia sociabilis TaxID=2080755 RepID=A0A432MF61_9BACT|nr:hypothetical protein [Tautonia sociabilis]RUL84580.1 hypothetical protein TsocGM_20100 [Tautonia sociabilis]